MTPPSAFSALGWLLWIVVISLTTASIGVFWLPPAARQPLPFDHNKHEKASCVVCHRGAENRVHAELPDINICLGCHAAAPFKGDSDIAAWNDAVTAKHIAWQRLTHVAQYVYFSHERHVGLARLECKICHGDMGSRSAPPLYSLVRISMARCMDCHRRDCASNDCARCHK